MDFYLCRDGQCIKREMCQRFCTKQKSWTSFFSNSPREMFQYCDAYFPIDNPPPMVPSIAPTALHIAVKERLGLSEGEATIVLQIYFGTPVGNIDPPPEYRDTYSAMQAIYQKSGLYAFRGKDKLRHLNMLVAAIKNEIEGYNVD